MISYRFALGVDTLVYMAKRTSSKKPPARPLGPDCRVVLLKGKEEFLRTQHTASFKEKLAEAVGGVDTFLFDGEKDDAADILDECRSFGLMSGHKLVIVDNAESFVKESSRTLVERYAQAPNAEATLVLRAATWRPGKLNKMILDVGTLVECNEVTPDQAMKWSRLRARKRHNAELGERAAWMLVERFGPDLGRLSSEVGKLAVAAGDGEISEAIVMEMCAGSREIEPWAVQQPMLSGNAPHTIASLRRILENAPRDAHVPVAMACAQLAANLHALGRSNRAEQSAVGKSRKLWGDRMYPVADAAARADPEALRTLLDAALDTDAKGKSGGGTPVIDLEALAVRCSQTLAGGGSGSRRRG